MPFLLPIYPLGDIILIDDSVKSLRKGFGSSQNNLLLAEMYRAEIQVVIVTAHDDDVSSYNIFVADSWLTVMLGLRDKTTEPYIC